MRTPLSLAVLLAFVALLAGSVDAARRPSRNAGASSAASSAAPLLARAAAASDGILTLASPAEFTQLLQPPRSHATALLLTAVDSGVPCAPCHTFVPHWKAVANSWRKKGATNKDKLVFASIEFKDGREVFQQVSCEQRAGKAGKCEVYTKARTCVRQREATPLRLVSRPMKRGGAEPVLLYVQGRGKWRGPMDGKGSTAASDPGPSLLGVSPELLLAICVTGRWQNEAAARLDRLHPLHCCLHGSEWRGGWHLTMLCCPSGTLGCRLAANAGLAAP
jgi:hypothetical protein